MRHASPDHERGITVDPSSFDPLTFDKGGDILLDEIRFGPSDESVLAGTMPMEARVVAPE